MKSFGGWDLWPVWPPRGANERKCERPFLYKLASTYSIALAHAHGPLRAYPPLPRASPPLSHANPDAPSQVGAIRNISVSPGERTPPCQDLFVVRYAASSRTRNGGNECRVMWQACPILGAARTWLLCSLACRKLTLGVALIIGLKGSPRHQGPHPRTTHRLRLRQPERAAPRRTGQPAKLQPLPVYGGVRPGRCSVQRPHSVRSGRLAGR